MPSRRTPFSVGKSGSSRAEAQALKVRETVGRIAEGFAWVICGNRANFTFRVTVRPPIPVAWQCRHTLAMMGSSASRIVSNV